MTKKNKNITSKVGTFNVLFFIEHKKKVVVKVW